MTSVKELRDALDQLVEMGMGDSELRLAIQPNYPLQELVGGLWFDEEEQSESDSDSTGATVYIVSGGQDHNSPYAPRRAFENPTLCF